MRRLIATVRSVVAAPVGTGSVGVSAVDALETVKISLS